MNGLIRQACNQPSILMRLGRGLRPRSLASISSRASASHSLTWRGNHVPKSRFKNFSAGVPHPPIKSLGVRQSFPLPSSGGSDTYSPRPNVMSTTWFPPQCEADQLKVCNKKTEERMNLVRFYQAVGADKVVLSVGGAIGNVPLHGCNKM